MIGNLLILFDRRFQTKILYIFLGNYFLATLFSLTAQNLNFHTIRAFDILMGLLTGLFFLINFLIYRHSIVLNGLSLSVSIMRIALIIPILASIFIFRQAVNPLKYIGIGVVITSFLLLADRSHFRSILPIFALFVITGCTETLLKLYDELGVPEQGNFILLLFFTAFLINLLIILIKRIPLHYLSFGCGLLLGIPNQLTTKYFLKSLQSVPAPIAYPMFAASVVIICFFMDILVWKKRFAAIKKIAYGIMISGIVLLNLQ
ncbi:MAG: hypothetical protein JXB60_05355 [Candidatus Cloacimonetes bacterium]|nr:hypothetical protein [Candidatus Cloacimonadota bacterium]